MRNPFKGFGKRIAESLTSRRIDKLDRKNSILSKKIELQTKKADINKIKKDGKAYKPFNGKRAVAGLLGGAITSSYLQNNKRMDDTKEKFNKFMSFIDKYYEKEQAMKKDDKKKKDK